MQAMEHMRQQMEQMQREMAEMKQQRREHEREEKQARRKSVLAGTRQSMAARVTMSPLVEEPSYSASAALPLPPIVQAAHRQSNPRRQSTGVPSSAFTPSTPAPQQSAVKMADLDEGEDSGNENDAFDDEPVDAAVYARSAAAVRDGMPAYDKRMAQVKKSITFIVKTFRGQTDKDTDNVIDWVEKLDTEFSIQMGGRQAGRLDIVRSLLGGSALKWMNRRLTELNEKVANGELDAEDVEWTTMRQPFIDAHLGINTIETFKAQLRALRLGGENNTKTPTPVEFNKEFDHLAELAYPDRRSEVMATVLGDEYGRLIQNSQFAIWESVTYNLFPSTIDQWKLVVNRRWTAGEHVKAARAARAAVAAAAQKNQKGGGGYQYRSRGGGAAGSAPAPNAAQAAGMNGGARTEGEEQTGEDDSDSQQLTAVPSSRGGRGGGRGGRGGRGGGRGGLTLGAREKLLYDQKKCFLCEQVGHNQYDCPTNANKSNQSNQ